MIELERRGEVALVTWDDGDNRFNLDAVARWHAVVDELEATGGPLGVVVTGTGRYFSNGLDLDRFAEHPDELGPVVVEMERLYGRLLVLDAYVVAAVNGHAFAAGALLATACDARVMRLGRGYFCLPEVDLGLPLSPAMTAVVNAHVPRPAALEAMLTGRRYAAEEALAAGIVEHVADEDDVVARAVELAAAVAGKDRKVLGIHKRQMHGAAAAACGVAG